MQKNRLSHSSLKNHQTTDFIAANYSRTNFQQKMRMSSSSQSSAYGAGATNNGMPENYIEIVPNRLYWCSVNRQPKKNSASSNTHHFCIDNDLVYEPFCADFGPLNLSCVYKYCKLLKSLLDNKSLAEKKVVHYTSICPRKRANAAFLMGCFEMVMLKRSSDEAWRPFADLKPAFLPFRDATSCITCSYKNTILDCLKGLEYAMHIGWFNINTFNCATYDYYHMIENGDMNWIVPDKFVAFAGPSNTNFDNEGYHNFTPEDFVPIFKAANVGLVVRLNDVRYDRRRFLQHGVQHEDLFFVDGSCPSRDIINKFLALVEHTFEHRGCGIGVHCKAGLGRTGTLIGLWAQKWFKFPGRAWIGWNRICRPGAMLGPQQQFMEDMERTMWAEGEAQRARLRGLPHQRSSQSSETVNDNDVFENKNIYVEDVGQGDRLTQAKRERQSPKAGGNIPSFTDLLPEGSSLSRKKSNPFTMANGAPSMAGMFGPQPVCLQE